MKSIVAAKRLSAVQPRMPIQLCMSATPPIRGRRSNSSICANGFQRMYWARAGRLSGIQKTGVRNISICITLVTIWVTSLKRVQTSPSASPSACALTSRMKKAGMTSSADHDSEMPAHSATGMYSTMWCRNWITLRAMLRQTKRLIGK